LEKKNEGKKRRKGVSFEEFKEGSNQERRGNVIAGTDCSLFLSGLLSNNPYIIIVFLPFSF